MDQVIDEPDECVLSTDQLTLMRLWLLQAKYFPLLIFSHASLSPLSLSSLPSLFPPHFEMEKSCYNSCGRFLAVYTAEWRNIYTMGYGDDSAQFVSLWRGMTFPFPSRASEVKEAFVRTETYTCRCIYAHKSMQKYAICKHCCGFRRSQCSCLPAAVCVLWGRVFGRGLVLGLMGGLKVEVSSSFSLIICLTSPLLCYFSGSRVCAEVSEGRSDEKTLPALCVGNPDKPKHNTTHRSCVMCEV